MSSFAKISIRFAADLKGFSSQMQNANRSMQKMGQNFTKIGQGMSLGITLPILGIGAAAVKAASDAEETSSKFNTVFRDVSKAAQESADTLRNAYGLSSNASKQLLSDTGDLLTGFGFSQDAALDLSTEVNKLAVDLASFTNYSGGAEGASQALTKALLGERESVKSLGISILEADVKARVLLNSQQGLTFETERQAKAFATLQIAQEQSKNAIGDYARTSEGFANQMRLVQARVNDLAVEFGEILLPYVNKLAGYVGKLVQYFSNLSPATKKVAVVVALLAAAVGPLLLGLGFLMTTVIPGLITAFAALTGPIALVIAAIAGIAFVIFKYWDPIKKQLRDLQNYFIDLYNESLVFRVGIESIVMAFNTLYNVAKLIISAIVTGFSNGGKLIIDIFKNIGSAFKAVLTGDIGALPGIIKKQADLIAGSFGTLFNEIGDDITAFTEAMEQDVQGSLDRIQKRKRLEIKTDLAVENVKGAEQALPPAGGGAGGRAAVSGLDFQGLKDSLAPIQQGPLDLIAKNMPAQVEAMNEQQLIALDNANQFNEGMSYAISNAAANFAAGFAQMIGSATSGGISLQGIGRLILGTIADMAIQVGQMAIGIGIAVIGIKKALQSLAGPVAIAAGIALVALGALAKSALSNVASGGGSGRTAFANGGIVYGPTNALIGEYAGAKNNPEVIAPLNKLKGMLADVVGGGSNNLSGEFTVRGKDLIYVLGQADQYYKRRG